MLALKQKWQMKWRLLVSETTGLSFQCLGPVEAGGEVLVELYAGLGALKPAVPETRVCFGKARGAGDAR